jgi:tetratricopeptide (TPR) repeat protein
MGSEKLSRVLELLKAEKASEAQNFFNEIEPVKTIEYFMVQGILEQKFQNWGKAINAFSKVIEIDPDNAIAKNNLHLIQSILNFWNPEMFNP